MPKQLVIIHIGKCGGGSIADAVKKGLIGAELVHVEKPKYVNSNQYVILIRDPVSRFISAFNWKMFRCTTAEGMRYQGMPKPKDKDEIAGYKYWKSIGNFADNLYNDKGVINPIALKLIKASNHLKFDISFYIRDLLPFLSKDNCQVIRCEYFDKDVKNILGISSIGNEKHVYNKEQFDSHVSAKGRRNLRRLLEKDYACFRKLRQKKLIKKRYFDDVNHKNR